MKSETSTKNKADAIIDGLTAGVIKPIKKESEVKVPEVKVPEVKVPEVKVPDTKRGVVIDCLVLAVRDTPDITGKLISTLKYGYDVFIDFEKSTERFYKISTKSGIDGFCKKTFIEIQ